MKASLSAACLALALACPASFAAGNRPATDVKPTPAPESDHFQSKDGFNALLLITDDAQWEEEWNTPAEHVPHFTQAHHVKVGGELHILSFLFNPQVDAQGMANVACDLLVTRPDGSASVDEKDEVCLKARVDGDPHNMYLSASTLKFTSRPGDLKGTYHVRIVMRDVNRGVALTLEDSFVNE
jgi:hypothetical protein